jgi:cyclic-di-AMP phosphodiesterase PgpH
VGFLQQILRGGRGTGAGSAATQRRWRFSLVLASLALAVVLWAILVIEAPINPGLTRGQPSPLSIQARESVLYESEWRTDLERTRAERATDTVVYTRDLAILTQQRMLLSDMLQTVTLIRNDPTLRPAEEREKLASLPASTLVISADLATEIARLDDEQWAEVRRLTLDLYDRAVGEYRFALDDQAVEQLRNFSLPYWASLSGAGESERAMIVLFSGSYLRSNLVLDEAATLERKREARAAVQPVMVQILEGESIVRAGDVVTPDVEEKLRALGELSNDTNWAAVGGKALLAGLTGLVFGYYMATSQPRLRGNRRALFSVVGLCIITALLARLVASLGWLWIYAFPLGVTALLLAALYQSGLALFMVGLLALPIAFLGGGQLDISAALLVGAVAGVFAVGRGERTLKFVLAGLAIGVATGATALGFALADGRSSSLEDLAALGLLGLVNGAMSAVIALGLYNVAGHAAGIVTPLRLMELAHPAQPLLRKLIREAPGTYYHSIAVGNLAESAAEAIGADALLLRVASYYHDIGKTVRPFFFTDNQSDRENVHNDLDPQTSAAIIADHVREGVALARAAGLPREIIDFIPSHHGTSLIRHFYQLALQQQDTVLVDDFRYPGPRPRTREQAIMMLADTVEATVRSKSQHGKIVSARDGGARNGDSQTLDELVASIIDERVRSGQLDESPLTLQDLARIRQAFLTTLQGIYHPRVEYTPPVVKMGE